MHCRVAVSVFVACASETGDSPASTVVVSTAAATTNPVVTATSEPTSTARPNAAVSRWTEDMEALGDGIRRIHPNPFWRQSEAEFDASLEAAPEHLAALGDNDARAEVMRLTATIDGHTGVYLGEVGFHLYAIHLYVGLIEIQIVTQHDRGALPAWKLGQGATQPIAVVNGVQSVGPGMIWKRAIRYLAVPLAPAPADRSVDDGRAHVRKRVTAGDHRLPPLCHLDQRDLHDILGSACVANDQLGTAHQRLAVGDDKDIEGFERSDNNGDFVLGSELIGTIAEIEAIDLTIGNENDPSLSPAHRHGHRSHVRIH